MAKDLTDVLRDQLQQALREFAQNLADGSEKERPRRRFSGMKGAVVGAGLALAAKKGIDVARQNPGLIEGVSSKISAKFEELQGQEESSAEADDEAETESESEADVESEPEPEAESEPAPKRKPRSSPSRRSSEPKAGSRARRPASTSTRRSSKSS